MRHSRSQFFILEKLTCCATQSGCEVKCGFWHGDWIFQKVFPLTFDHTQFKSEIAIVYGGRHQSRKHQCLFWCSLRIDDVGSCVVFGSQAWELIDVRGVSEVIESHGKLSSIGG